MLFTDELRRVTDDAHSAAERSPFITELLGGERTASDYAALIAQYEPIYATLEELVRGHASDEPLPHFAEPHLERTDAIRDDLAAMRAAGIDVPDARVPATTRFVDHLRDVADEPLRLLAHHYLRYLGDLSGGLVIGRLAARNYEIPTEALTMWNFDGIDKPKRFKDSYRARLNEHVSDEVSRATFIDEAVYGYRISGELFADLTRTAV